MFKHSYTAYKNTSYMERNGVYIQRQTEGTVVDGKPDERTIIRTNKSGKDVVTSVYPPVENATDKVNYPGDPRIKQSKCM